MKHELMQLPFEYNSLEPFIDEQTMKIHHTKHHQAYVNKLNTALENNKELQEKTLEELISGINSVPKEIQTAVKNNGGGVINHNFFWTVLKKDSNFGGEIAEAITKKFGSFEKFKEEFSNAAATLFGSGWAWLVLNNGKLEIIQTKNQDSPLSTNKIPLLALDIWEHSYYLKYMNNRPAYIEAFFNIINWDKVDELYKKAKE
ncbi:superoxide dismutase [Candidatus Micrarchaeota archaeon]|nr:superoxide dismutase [Candidatus Micrarchaeota archaeon]MBU2476750.1 superoxide dismutase [Candidatus Micrarchaeota archaeon]